MTPQERARDLCEKFEGILGRSIPTGDDPFFPESKECAKMCVQEIISIEGYNDGPPGSTYYNPGKYFWMQVLKEIDKL